MQWLDTEPIEIKYVGFSTTRSGFIFSALDLRLANVKTQKSASSGEFKIWRKDSDDQTYSDLVKLEIPNNAIQGSESGEVVVIGDVMGPTLKNLDKLLKLPFGCGEQNMINFAPNLYILDYLHGTKKGFHKCAWNLFVLKIFNLVADWIELKRLLLVLNSNS